MLLLARSPQTFSTAELPDWVKDWSSRRRTGAAPSAETVKPAKASFDAALAELKPEPKDEKSEARAAQQRERLKTQREESIISGLDELDLWIGDQLNRGLAGFMATAAQNCRSLAQRMVDAKAPGLAGWIDSLPGRLLVLSEQQRTTALIEALGELHLFAQAYRRQDYLPEALRHDIRRIAGWTTERQVLLDMPGARRVSAGWLVTGAHTEIQPDKLRRVETWLLGKLDGQPVNAVLIDFVPVGTGAAISSFLPGDILEAELVFYPSAVPLRAIIANRLDQFQGRLDGMTGCSLGEALKDYTERRAMFPWLAQWPLTLSGARCVEYEGYGLWIIDGADGLPVSVARQDEVRALTGVDVASITGLWDGSSFAPQMAETSLGRWICQ